VRAGAERADFGHLGRTEAAREGKLAVVGHLLAAKHQHRMFFESSACRRIGGIVGGNIGERDAAQFGGKTRPQRDDVHRHVLPDFIICLIFLQNEQAGKEAKSCQSCAGHPRLLHSHKRQRWPRKPTGGNDEQNNK